MEWLLAAGIVAAAVVAARHQVKVGAPPAPPSSSSTPPSSTPPKVLPPGVYPPATPGALPVQISVVGGCGEFFPGNGRITARPGGPTITSATIWFGAGTQVQFSADQPSPSPFIAFDHFEGPGVSTRDNPFTATIQSPGYVKAVFACLGIPGL